MDWVRNRVARVTASSSKSYNGPEDPLFWVTEKICLLLFSSNASKNSLEACWRCTLSTVTAQHNRRMRRKLVDCHPHNGSPSTLSLYCTVSPLNRWMHNLYYYCLNLWVVEDNNHDNIIIGSSLVCLVSHGRKVYRSDDDTGWGTDDDQDTSHSAHIIRISRCALQSSRFPFSHGLMLIKFSFNLFSWNTRPSLRVQSASFPGLPYY